MDEKTRVFEVKKIWTKQVDEEKFDKFILELKDGEWVLRTPNASQWTVELLAKVIEKLTELNANETAPKKDTK